MYLAMTLPKTFKRWGIETRDRFFTGSYDLVTLPGQCLERHFTIRNNTRAVDLLKYNPLLEVALVPYSAIDQTPEYRKQSQYFDGNCQILLNSDHAWMIYLTSRQMAERLIKLRCVGYFEHFCAAGGLRPPIHEITDRYVVFEESGASKNDLNYVRTTLNREKAQGVLPEDDEALSRRISELFCSYNKPQNDYWELRKRWERKITRLVLNHQLICCY